MTKLKNEIQQKCFTLLKEFIDAVKVAANDLDLQEKKEEALEALELLKQLEIKPSDLKSSAVPDGKNACSMQAQICPPSA